MPSVPEWRNWQTQQTQNLSILSGREGSIPSSGTNRNQNPVHSVPFPIPVFDHRLSWRDRWGGALVRLGIGRGRYRIKPGLYALGQPDAESEVLVTANYKLSFDSLRRRLPGRKLWILVLDTRGVNVWCAAGKGTFSDAAILRMVKLTGLERMVRHRRLILPQLGAPGVAAHKVTAGCGFQVLYGPVRAADLPRFLDGGLQADAAMRRVDFPLRERLAVAMNGLLHSLKYIGFYLLALSGVLALAGMPDPMSWLSLALPPVGAVFVGAWLVPAWLGLIPLRSFSLKGALLGLLWGIGCALFFAFGPWAWIASLTLLPAISAFMALNYTGSTPFTCQSGVNREIARYARPMALCALLGLIAFILGVLL